MSSVRVTGSMLRDLVTCERRVHHDLHTDPTHRDGVGAFVSMLWEGGMEHERAILGALPGPVADLRDGTLEERALFTIQAMHSNVRFILGPLLEIDDRLGMPDFLERRDGRWVAGDVKSGAATKANGVPRLEYAVQVAHYASLLEAIGEGPSHEALVIGRDSTTTIFDLDAPYDREGRSITQITASFTDQVRLIRDRKALSRGATSATCGLCHWYTLCAAELKEMDDPSLIAGVGRAVRDALLPHAPTVAALAGLDLAPLALQGGRSLIPRVGSARLARFRDRARLLRTPNAAAYALRPLGLMTGHREIHFDIETDPMRDNFVYLHGFLVRDPVGDGFSQRYHYFFAETIDDEAAAFAQSMQYLMSDPSAHIYYYSKYERSLFRTLALKYPGIYSRDEVEALFDPERATDLLFDVITPHTEWPTPNLSIKTLARHLGFDWRDVEAGGAASIAWFNEYAATRDPAVKRRILSYNEDDVRASAVVLDGLRALKVSGPPPWPPGNQADQDGPPPPAPA